tara:strand:+ start:993 stop:1106 length:114 start_codon:yes stop_codon:yes gene_type:complete
MTYEQKLQRYKLIKEIADKAKLIKAAIIRDKLEGRTA